MGESAGIADEGTLDVVLYWVDTACDIAAIAARTCGADDSCQTDQLLRQKAVVRMAMATAPQ